MILLIDLQIRKEAISNPDFLDLKPDAKNSSASPFQPQESDFAFQSPAVVPETRSQEKLWLLVRISLLPAPPSNNRPRPTRLRSRPSRSRHAQVSSLRVRSGFCGMDTSGRGPALPGAARPVQGQRAGRCGPAEGGGWGGPRVGACLRRGGGREPEAG